MALLMMTLPAVSLDNRQGLQNGNTAADECAQGARETGDGHPADDRSQHRHLELEFVPDITADFRF